MDKTTEIRALLKQVVEAIRETSFIPAYQAKATDAECLGMALSKYFEWDNRIFDAFLSALEDANFHTQAEQIAKMAKKAHILISWGE